MRKQRYKAFYLQFAFYSSLAQSLWRHCRNSDHCRIYLTCTLCWRFSFSLPFTFAVLFTLLEKQSFDLQSMNTQWMSIDTRPSDWEIILICYFFFFLQGWQAVCHFSTKSQYYWCRERFRWGRRVFWNELDKQHSLHHVYGVASVNICS